MLREQVDDFSYTMLYTNPGIGREDGESTTRVVRARWVDSHAEPENGKCRVITAGGVSCGIDATFQLVEMTCGVDLTEKIERQMDYARRYEERQY